ncbi:hypothetical protein BG011_004386 [Mortierella polycephala]|uniref:C2H2-type domain-containing protein n=1 Tax=Mortierella polycephala TaxID=41804 RepID=A0A9P6U9Y5_9FUNG|nr:hypothetical protein BG011_004386 [Mortierella polycephala]
MDPSSLLKNSTLKMMNDLNHNPFYIGDTDHNNTINNDSSTSAICLDNSKSSNNTSTSATAKTDIIAAATNNNTSSAYNTYDVNYWNIFTSAHDMSTLGLDLTPELSPSMSFCSPAVNSVNSPYPFDPLGLDDSGLSPSIAWDSPLDEPLGAQHFSELFDSDINFGSSLSQQSVWEAQTDFQLFPDCGAESASLEKLLMTLPATENILSTIQESPFEASLCFNVGSLPASTSVSPAELGNTVDTFTTAKLLGHDVQVPVAHVAPRKPVQSPTKPGFQPNKRRRRRRTTTEDAHRRVPEEQLDDPDAKARFYCNKCDKSFTRATNLRSHRAIHQGLKPFVCTRTKDDGVPCHWAFARRHDLERHVRSRHEKERTFRCKSCGIRCTRSDAIRRHLAKNAACREGTPQDQDEDQVSFL